METKKNVDEAVVYDVTCPECEYVFRMEDPIPAEVIICADCSLNLKVKSVDASARAVVLELTDTPGEDWGE